MRAQKKHSVLVLGDVNIDWIIDVADVNNPINSIWKESTHCIRQKLGGAGAIFSIAAHHVGFESYIVGKVGNDPYGEYVRKELIDRGVNAIFSVNDSLDTGKVLIIRDGNDNKAMVSHRGANTSFQKKDISVDIKEKFDILYISGYTLLEAPQSTTIIDIVRRFKKNNSLIVLDIVPHRIFLSDLPSEYLECLELADAIILEQGTAQRMLRLTNEPVELIINKLLEKYRLVVLTPTNEIQIVASLAFAKYRKSGYLQSANKVGHLDRNAAKILFDYLEDNINGNNEYRDLYDSR